jgi:hypothetical protein
LIGLFKIPLPLGGVKGGPELKRFCNLKEASTLDEALESFTARIRRKLPSLPKQKV